MVVLDKSLADVVGDGPPMDIRTRASFGIMGFLQTPRVQKDEEIACWAQALRAEGEYPLRFEYLTFFGRLDFGLLRGSQRRRKQGDGAGEQGGTQGHRNRPKGR